MAVAGDKDLDVLQAGPLTDPTAPDTVPAVPAPTAAPS